MGLPIRTSILGNGVGTVEAADDHDLVKKFYAIQIIFCNSIFTLYVKLIKICSKITSCAKKITWCAIKVTHNKKYIQSTETIAPATVCAPYPFDKVVDLCFDSKAYNSTSD